MTVWLVACAVVLLGAVVPAAVCGLRDGPVERLVGVQQMAAAVSVFLMLFAQQVARSDYLIVPLVLVLVSFAGALVYARLLVPRR